MKIKFLIIYAFLLIAAATFFSTLESNTARAYTQTASCTNVPASPDYLDSGSLDDAIAAINNARALEHVHPLHLPQNFAQLDAVQQQFVLVNLERTDRGLRPLRLDSNLSQIASNYSKQLRNLNFFSHSSPISGSFVERIDSNKAIAGHYSYVGENIAGNPVASAGAMYEYMYDDVDDSCNHRANILNTQLDLVGIGVVMGGEYGSMSAQEFLGSASWNHYRGMAPVKAAPSLKVNIKVNARQGVVNLSSGAHSSINITRITWFVDGLHGLSHRGSTWNLPLRNLKHGTHTIYTYAVDGQQTYPVTQRQLKVY